MRVQGRSRAGAVATIASAVVGAVAAAVLPARCPGCGRAADPICPECAAGLRPPPGLTVPAPLDGWVAAFAYEGVAREIVARVKYRNERAAIPWLAASMAAALAQRYPDEAPAIVTWAPASADRRRGTGFDHGELLGRAVAARLDLPAARLITREPGPPQTGRSRAERRPGPALEVPGAAFAAVRGRAVLLVDDVATTGATLAVAGSVLRRAGADRVVALTAAATPGRPSGPAVEPSDLPILRR